MGKHKINSCEQETTFNLYPKSAGLCEIYSCEPVMIKKIRKYIEEYPDEVILDKEDEIGIFAYAPRRWFKFSPPRRSTMTEEQRKAAGDRLRAMRQEKNDLS